MEAKREHLRPDKNWSRKTSETVDNVVGIFSPRRAFERRQYRFAYDAIDSSRLRKKRIGLGGTADKQLTETNLYKLREICREMGRNNPLVNGLLKIERNGLVGSGVRIQARTGDEKLDEELEAAWREQMLDKPCDVTGRFNINQFLRKMFLSYRRDGDIAAIFLDDKLQAVEGEQIGTPWDGKIGVSAEYYDIVNGIAYSKKTGELLGYYIGKADRWGYIKNTSFEKYPASVVHHMFDSERFSQSRGEPVLTSSIKFIDTLCDYIDAELVAAKVQACFSMFVATSGDMPDPYTGGISDTGRDTDENQLEKMEPGIISYGEPGQTPHGVGMTRPSSPFDPFVLRILTFIGRPLCMPLMLMTGDFSGATFMNARLAYQKVQEEWEAQQDNIIKPFISRVWRWKLQRLSDNKDIKVKNEKLRKKIFRHEILCKRWPYVDPWKEAKADEQEIQNGTLDPIEVCARQGRDFEEVTKNMVRANKIRQKEDLPELPQPKPKQKLVKQPVKQGA